MIRPKLPRVLLVDDEPDHLRLLCDCLTPVNCQLTTAVNGRQALAICRQERFDLGIVDVRLPDLSGMELIPQLRAWNPQMGFFLITAFAEVSEAVRAVRDLEAYDYIEKPFSPADVRDRVSSYLVQRGHSRQLEVKGLVIKPEARRVELNGKAVKLTRQEFDLLLFVMRSPGRVVSYEELIVGVWRCEPSPSDLHLVRITMSRLRKALEDDSHTPSYSQTVRGVGYQAMS